MAEARLRFSGWHIPFELWDDHPCWEFALDEEGLAGQDETTMRPCDEPFITKFTSVVAGYAVGANGERLPAMVSLKIDRASANGLKIYVDRKFDGRVVELQAKRDGTWREYPSKPSWRPDWTSAKSEPGLLPVRFVSLAPHKQTGLPFSITVTEVA